MIELTDLDGVPFWARASDILTMWPIEGGTCVSGANWFCNAIQTPADILALIAGATP